MTPERFVALLAALGWSQRALADRLGLPSHTTVKRWAGGVSPIPDELSLWLERVAAGVVDEPVPPGWLIRQRQAHD